jgi:hypothetical protein
MTNLRIIPGSFPKFKKFLDRIKELFLVDKNTCMNKTLKSNNQNNTILSQTATTVKAKMSNTTGSFKVNSGSKSAKRVSSSNKTKNSQIQRIYSTGPGSAGKPSKSAEPTARANENIVQTFFTGQGFGFNYYLDDKTPNINIVQSKDILKDSLREDDINQEIDKLLNYYMSQLKESKDFLYF